LKERQAGSLRNPKISKGNIDKFMSIYELELSPAAKRDLKDLPVNIQREVIFKHLPIIKETPFQSGRPLVGVLHKERSYHFGRRPEYRIIYQNIPEYPPALLGG